MDMWRAAMAVAMLVLFALFIISPRLNHDAIPSEHPTTTLHHGPIISHNLANISADDLLVLTVELQHLKRSQKNAKQSLHFAKQTILDLTRQQQTLKERINELEVSRAQQTSMCDQATSKSSRVTEFAFRAKIPPSHLDVTITTQLSMDRLSRLVVMTELWRGPVAAVIYVREEVADIERVKEFRSLNEQVELYVDFHLVRAMENEKLYPVNYLRNIAIKLARSGFVFPLDVDLAPCWSCRTSLNHHAQHLLTSQQSVLVVPTFELNVTDFCIPTTSDLKRTCAHDSTPHPFESKETLVEMARKGQALPVHIYKFEMAHAPTNYSRWYSSNTAYSTQYSLMYEPYVVIKKPCPLYDERFVGYGLDKASHCLELQAAMYSWVVVPDAYLIHIEHQASGWRRLKNYTSASTHFWEFAAEIETRYGFPTPIPKWFDQWQEARSQYLQFVDNSGHGFYFDRHTNETTWQLPSELEPQRTLVKEQREMAFVSQAAHPAIEAIN